MVFAFLFLPIVAFSHVIQDDVSTVDKISFPIQRVCEKTVGDSPLTEVISGTEIDCMGRKVEVATFCEKEMAQDPYYIRAYVDREKKEVVCHSGKKVLFKYLCVKLADRKLCNGEARKSCLTLKSKLARRLDLVHASEIKNEKGIKQLNCFYESLPLNEFTHARL